MKYFYSHLIQLHSVYEELDDMDLTPEEKQELAELLEGTLHHTILDAVLEQLSPEDKHLFLQHVKSGDHDTIWKFLQARVDKIESHITKTAEDLQEQLHQDIKEAQKRR